MAAVARTVEFKDKKRKKGYKEKKRSKRTAQYDSGSEEEEERTKLQKLEINEDEPKDTKMIEVYEGANFEKEASSDEDRESDGDEGADDEGETNKNKEKEKEKDKKGTKDSAFADAMKQILGSDIGTPNAPILSKNKVLTKIIDRQKTREKEQKAVAAQKQAIISKYHLRPDITTNKDEEMKLRKIATKGVVQLFTAVTAAQTSQKKEEKDKLKKTVTVDGEDKQVGDMESAAFLDLLKGNMKTTTRTKKVVKPVIKKEIKSEIKKEKEVEYEDD